MYDCLQYEYIVYALYVYENGHILWPKHAGLVNNKYRATKWK
jgi:hypothetical protein